jgi:hypothetical protein
MGMDSSDGRETREQKGHMGYSRDEMLYVRGGPN